MLVFLPIVSLAGLKGSHTKEKIITVFYAKKRKQASHTSVFPSKPKVLLRKTKERIRALHNLLWFLKGYKKCIPSNKRARDTRKGDYYRRIAAQEY